MFDALLGYGWQGLILSVYLALAVGSFLNVVIYRLPVMLDRQWRRDAREILELPAEPAPEQPFNLMVPRSRCPRCGKLITAWQNIPVLSWLLLRGRCGSCKASISPRYPLIELLTMVMTLAALSVWGLTWTGLFAALFTWVIIALTFIDFDTQLLPDQLTLPLLWLGLLANNAGMFVSLEAAVIGAVAGYLFLWSTYWGFKLLTGKEGMGYGDFKLFAAIGAWFGWQVLPGTILMAALLGLLYALVTTLLKQRENAQPIAFGPFLAVGGWVSLLARDNVVGFFVT
jgi:leader peptidase (prepilin peptidase)/N-methyltransferase